MTAKTALTKLGEGKMSNKFKILGVNDHQSYCECCGKGGLKKVVWIENLETGEIQHFGSTCATNPEKAFGITKQDIDKKVRQQKKEEEERVKEEAFKARSAENDRQRAIQRLVDAAYMAQGGSFNRHSGKANDPKLWEQLRTSLAA